ncbi:MAG: hypothetical protein JOY71_22675 [Acetobacteraceae bacterium]|nr:hypothetical protein [Acetobacteraceae bacterium]MBV8524887.1 hypothetical protein [Acetobacteraceae bacterium]
MDYSRAGAQQAVLQNSPCGMIGLLGRVMGSKIGPGRNQSAPGDGLRVVHA